jgi:hypothetical protein
MVHYVNQEVTLSAANEEQLPLELVLHADVQRYVMVPRTLVIAVAHSSTYSEQPRHARWYLEHHRSDTLEYSRRTVMPATSDSLPSRMCGTRTVRWT